MLAVNRPGAQEALDRIEGAAKLPSRRDAPEAPRASEPVLNPAVILFKPAVETDDRSMPRGLAESAPDRGGVGIVTVGGNPVWHHAGHRPGGMEERPGSGKIILPAQLHTHQGPIAVGSSIQTAPPAVEQEHPGQIAEARLIPQAQEHLQCDNVARVRCPAQSPG